MALLHDYKAHIKGVQRDRMLEATLQGENIFMGSKPILFVQTDGMDQSKWACPRLSLRSSKQQAKYIRSLSSNSPDNGGQCCFVPLGHGWRFKEFGFNLWVWFCTSATSTSAMMQALLLRPAFTFDPTVEANPAPTSSCRRWRGASSVVLKPAENVALTCHVKCVFGCPWLNK